MTTGASDYSRVEQAIRYLQEHAAEQPGLAELAREVGLSEFHFQRLFRRWAGITPKDFLQCLTLSGAKELLAASHSLLETSAELGLSGPSRLHDLFLTLEAMTPGEFKRAGEGLIIRWGIHATPYGEALFAITERGLCALEFLDPQDAGTRPLMALNLRWPNATLMEDALATEPFARAAVGRMLGQAPTPLALHVKGSSFQIGIWKALLAIPEGRVLSYQSLARLAGYPGASRAAGSALAMNPIAYLIPCHRVIRATGVVGDYRWGSPRKRVLLGVEGARALAGASAS